MFVRVCSCICVTCISKHQSQNNQSSESDRLCSLLSAIFPIRDREQSAVTLRLELDSSIPDVFLHWNEQPYDTHPIIIHSRWLVRALVWYLGGWWVWVNRMMCTEYVILGIEWQRGAGSWNISGWHCGLSEKLLHFIESGSVSCTITLAAACHAQPQQTLACTDRMVYTVSWTFPRKE